MTVIDSRSAVVQQVPPGCADLFLFATGPEVVTAATAAGVHGFVVDWERRGKARRQAGFDTQIGADTLDDLVDARRSTSRRVLCRVNGYGPWTADEVESAVTAGADELLLPMVRTADEVDAVLDLVRGRCGLGILVETQDAGDAATDLLARPLSRVYVGLNDLRIDRRADCLFTPLVDGTVERLRAQAGPLPFGVAGLTHPDSGHPVPSRLLAAELDRLQAGFTFLRRSFTADTERYGLAETVAATTSAQRALGERPPRSVDADRRLLCQAVREEAVGSLLIDAAATARGLRVTHLRAFQVYGPGDKPRRLVPSVLRAARTGAVLPLTGAGRCRDWVYVGDVVDAVLLALAADGLPPGEVLNVSTGTDTSNEELVAVAETVTGRRIRTEVGACPDRSWDAAHWRADPRRAERLLGWRATTPLAEGLRRCWQAEVDEHRGSTAA